MQAFPFSAIVGADDLQLALTLTAVSPSIGGVLVRGEKGTAKSTAVRAQTALLPPVETVVECRFGCDPHAPDPACPDGPHPAGAASARVPARLVELPVGATEDRVTGSLHLGKALSGDGAQFEPGLLAGAHRGTLYVDEVNLLHDHLVDLLLDAAAMGRVSVERDGVSVSHAARFVLVGTMNPEEGELRPQLLDRFGLAADVAAPRDAQVRAEIVRRRLAFDADPEGFAAQWADEEAALAERIARARELAPRVELTDAALTAIAEVCAAFDVDGMRADLVTARAATAHAAWCGRTEVTREDIAAGSRLALPHRRRRNPFDEPGIDDEKLEEVLGEHAPEDPGPEDDGPEDDGPGGGAPEPEQVPPSGDGGAGDDGGSDAGPDDGPEGPESTTGPANAGDSANQRDSEDSEDSGDHRPAPASVDSSDEPFRAKLLSARRTGRGDAGNRSRARTTIGRTVGERRGEPGADSAPVHLPATIRASAMRRGAVGGTDGRPIRPRDIRRKVVEGRETNLVLLCVDASGSMAARKRMAQVKSAVLSLLLDAYRRRDTVGLVTFRGDGAELVLPPTNSVDLAASRLATLPSGGRTPLAEGLGESAETLRRHRLRSPGLRPLLIVVTDGRATAGPEPVPRSLRAADAIAADGTDAVVLDCETGRFRMGLARTLAGRMDAEYVPVGDVRADTITAAVQQTRTDTTDRKAA